MNGNYSQIQLHKELREVAIKLDKLISIMEKFEKQEMIRGLDKGLKELKQGKGKLYKSSKEWYSAMKM